MGARKISLSRSIYYVSIFIYFLCGALSNSMITQVNFLSEIAKYGQLAAIFGIIAKILIKKIYVEGKIKVSVFALWCVVLGLCAAILISINATLPLYIMLVLLGAEGCSGKTIAKIYLCSTGSVVLLSTFLSQIGVIEDRIFYRAFIYVRHSLGMNYVTIWAAFTFFMCMAWIYVRKDKIKWFDYLLLIFVGFCNFYFCDARLEAYMLWAVCVVMFVFKRISKTKIFKYVSVFSFPVSAVISFAVQFIYMSDPSRMTTLDSLLSGRLRQTALVLSEYPFKLLGVSVRFQGHGTVNFDEKYGYFFIDSFYMNYGLKFGLLFVLFLCIIVPIVCKRLADTERDWELLFVFLSSIHGIIISSILLAYINPFFVIAIAEYTAVRAKYPRTVLNRNRRRIRLKL